MNCAQQKDFIHEVHKTLLEKKIQLGKTIIMEENLPLKTMLQLNYLPTSKAHSPKDYFRKLIGEMDKGKLL